MYPIREMISLENLERSK